MITVTVDCNNDRIELDNGADIPPLLIAIPSRSMADMELLLMELLNILDHSGTELVRIDEDTRRTIGEW